MPKIRTDYSPNAMEENNYLKYRGHCKEMAEALVKNDPTLTLVRGWYYDPLWGEQQHWWTKDQNGQIIDPSKDQFPSKGAGVYVEFDGYLECEYCGKRVPEEEADTSTGHVYCSYECYGHDVGF